ncbi:cytochrome c biogenesis protein [Mangrovimonas xylaniphaga]|uniref:cytochrome c biogenesis protein n=1 Tax=Mangrovimonas xylaniphaga TaxID=1645915 RepID=UPI0006B477A3|nr:cytochrome c biogenesis protein CcsA [Mangrovimonas xylaniphaga]
MNKLYRFFSSSIVSVILLLVFAVAMAAATFVENDFGTPTAWHLIYDAYWFELVMLGLSICFVFNIFKYKLWNRKKWAILLFHLAFIVIICGAAITRYTSESGIMRIREGASSSTIISTNNFVRVQFSEGITSKVVEKQVQFAPLEKNIKVFETDFEGQPFSLEIDEFLIDAQPKIVSSDTGKPLLELVVANEQSGRNTIILHKGEIETVGPNQETIGFESPKPTTIQFSLEGEGLKIKSQEELSTFVMASQQAGVLPKDSLQEVSFRTLHRAQGFSFVPLTFHSNGEFVLESSASGKNNDKNKDDAVLVTVKSGDEVKSTSLLFREGFLPTNHPLQIGDVSLSLSYGSRAMEIPFALRLEDFQLERYPGSTSPSAYASELTILDGEAVIPYRIFMNNVLDHKGYRFFQASYDTDEQGTVLSVNKDRTGTMVSYLGYLLMGLGMCFTLFGKYSRFRVIGQKLKKLKQAVVLVLLLLACSFGIAQENKNSNLEDLLERQQLDKEQAELFGRLLVQDLDGRIKPINTLASEFLRKLSRKPYFKNGDFVLTADQAFMAMHVYPNDWQDIPVIKIDREKGGGLFHFLEPNAENLVTFKSLVDVNGNYLLSEAVEVANQKKPAERNEQDKEVLKVDERFNVLFNVLSGSYLKIFPNKNDPNNTWFPPNHNFIDFPEEDAVFAKNILPIYFNDVVTGDENEAVEKWSYIDTYQNVLAKEIIPSEKRINAEIWYNKLNLNFWLFQVFFTLGAYLLVMAIVRIFVQNKLSNLMWDIGVVLTLVAFLIFVGNIILRWYVAQHAPWSNGYEMMVFVACVLLLCGLLTFRKSDFALPLATLFSGALLFVSYLDWLNPEITNLMPVLKSYWLKVHVATIVSSYAPLALSAVLGCMALLLMIFKNSKTAEVVNVRILELTYINEMAMTIGLFVLAVGTFLGGIWANESWGRYWAWDAKETWALISIIVYAVVLHLRFIPKLNNSYILNVASMFAFWSIIMTSFGVNYYLSGLHSYAAGDPLPIPKFVFWVAASMFIVAGLAYFKTRKKSSMLT